MENSFIKTKPKILIATGVGLLAVLLIASAFIFYFWKMGQKKETEKILDDYSQTEKQIIDSASKASVPSLQTNPLEDKPNINPAEKTNPINNIKTNPFE